MFFLKGREELSEGTKHFLWEASCSVTLEYAGTLLWAAGLCYCGYLSQKDISLPFSHVSSSAYRYLIELESHSPPAE